MNSISRPKPVRVLAWLLVVSIFAPLILSGYALAGTLKVTGTASPMTIDATLSVSFTCSPTAGVKPYTFLWAFGDGGTSTLQNPSHTYNVSGSYTAMVTVNDKNGQNATWTSGIITVNALPSVTGTATPTTIDATQTVSFTCTPKNGTSPFSYSWDFGDGSPRSTLQNPSYAYAIAGTYAASVTVTDTFGKIAFWIAVIIVNPLPIVTGTAAPTTIDETQSVSFTSTPTNGTVPYTYSWAFGDGGTSALQNPSYVYGTAGSYTATITVTDKVGKTASWSSGTITVNPLPTVTGSATPSVIDLGQAISFTSSPTGGTTPYTYFWTFGDGMTSTLQNPSHAYGAVGAHTAGVVLTDAVGKQASWTVVITVNALPSVTGTATPTTIDATQSVSFTCAPKDGTSPYSYLWDFGDGSPGSTAQNPSHVYATNGSYIANVTATDAVGEHAHWEIGITVNPLSNVTGTATPTTIDVTQNVFFTSTAHYGTPPYTYYWVFGDGATSTQENPAHAYNVAGTYTANVTVTDSVGINASWTVVITVNPLPNVVGTSTPTMVDSGQIVSFTCTPANGTAPYTFFWDLGGAPGRFVYSTTNQSQSPFYEYENPGSSPATYVATVTITDALGMEASWTSPTITVYAQPSVIGTASPTTIDAGHTVSFNCTADFGSGVYPSYIWAFGDGPANTSAARNTTHEYDAAGSYFATVTVTDSLGAQAIWTVEITVMALPTVTGTASPKMIDETQTVSFTCTPSQGVGPYSYLWAFGDDPANTSTARNTTHQYDAAGSYVVMVTVTDSFGEQATWTVDITVNPWLNVTGTASKAAIDVGHIVSFTCTPSYGTTPYAFYWTFGDGGTSTLQNPSHAFTTLGPHASNVTVTDAVGGQASWTIIIVVNALPTLTGAASPTETDSGLIVTFTCAPSFGTEPYSYLWDLGDGSPGIAAQNLTHAYATTGSYVVNVTATDAVGEQANWTVVITVNALPSITGTASRTTIDATQAVSFTCTPRNGTQPYTYSWMFGDGGTSTLQDPSYTYTDAGTYEANVTVTDSVGASASWAVVITVNVLPSVNGTATSTIIDATQSVSFTCAPSNGTMPYTYDWSFGDGGTSSLQNPSHVFASAGLYTSIVTVTDAVGEHATWAIDVTVNALPSIAGTATPSTIDENQSVSFTCTPNGGTSPFTYLWSFDDGSPDSTAQDSSHIYGAPGSYQVTVTATDALGEETNWTVVITVNALPSVSGVAARTMIDATQSVSFTCTPSNGTSPYTYSWAFGDGGTSDLQNPSHAYGIAGSYTALVTLTDASGMQATWTVIITVNTLPNITGSATPMLIDATQSVSFTCTASNGTSPYTYLWDFGDGSPESAVQNASHVFASAGSYSVNVTTTDALGGQAMWTVVITVNPLPSITGTASPTTIDATQVVSFTGTPSYGIAPYTYSWVFGDGGTSSLQNPSHSYNTAGTYTATVTLTDSAGEVASWTGDIRVNAPPSVTGTATPAAIHSGQSVSFTCAPTGGTAPYSYLWDFGDGATSTAQSPEHKYSHKGTYTVTVTVTDDANTAAEWTTVITVSSIPLSMTVIPMIGALGGILAITFLMLAARRKKKETDEPSSGKPAAAPLIVAPKVADPVEKPSVKNTQPPAEAPNSIAKPAEPVPIVQPPVMSVEPPAVVPKATSAAKQRVSIEDLRMKMAGLAARTPKPTGEGGAVLPGRTCPFCFERNALTATACKKCAKRLR